MMLPAAESAAHAAIASVRWRATASIGTRTRCQTRWKGRGAARAAKTAAAIEIQPAHVTRGSYFLLPVGGEPLDAFGDQLGLRGEADPDPVAARVSEGGSRDDDDAGFVAELDREGDGIGAIDAR